MKNIISILTLVFLFTSCKNQAVKSDGYVVNGTANGIYNGMRVYLKSPGDRGRQTPQDTAIVMDGNFKFEGKIQYPQLWYLSVDNIPGILPVMVENETISVDFNKDQIAASKVSGTKANDALSKYNKGFQELIDKRLTLNSRYTAQTKSDTLIAESKMVEELNMINKEIQAYPMNFLQNNNDNYFSLSLIENILKNNPTEFEEIDAAYANIDKTIRTSLYGQVVGSEIDAIKKKNEELAMLNIGKIAPDFTAPDPDGTPISMHAIRGKATIIDFWAAWCGPCRRENPNVVKVYDKFHDKGLEIISVSLDRPGQKDKWLKAIADDKLDWHHVSHLTYFNDPVAQQYNIQSIPATFILDADGKIVAKNLRGQALEDKIAEMLN